jgi:hypothetical protein
MTVNLRIWAAAAVSSFAMASAAQAANLVANGDFEGGNTGFGSDYTYVSGPGSAIPPAVYALDTSPANVHPSWANFGDHTTGSGLMMIVNGSLNTGDTVWSQGGLTVAANTTYYFSTWVASSYPDSPAMLDFSINGVKIGGTFTAGGAPGQWGQFFAAWDSGANTTANISLVNQNGAYGGNDFALDDISFGVGHPGDGVPEPATWAMMLVGFAGMGATLRTRRRAAALA